MSNYTITKEQLRSLTDPKVKEMFPDAFENILEEGKWYKSEGVAIAFCEEIMSIHDFKAHVVWCNDDFDKYAELGFSSGWQPATQDEVFDALKRAAIKMGYKKGLYCIFGRKKHIRAIEEDGFRLNLQDINALIIGSDYIFIDGEWAEIVNKKLL
jgi:hypothetical protein